MPTIEHDVEVVEDPVDGASAFASCRTCGWLGRTWEDYPVDDEAPPPALEGAYRERYAHLHRTRSA
jgi:hypothetical protein